MDTEDGVHMHNAVILRNKEGWDNAISSYSEETRDDHSKWTKWDKERQVS